MSNSQEIDSEQKSTSKFHLILGILIIFIIICCFTFYFKTSKHIITKNESYFFSFDDFYLNKLEGDEYKVYSFSFNNGNCTSILMISDNEKIFENIFKTDYNISDSYYYYFYDCINENNMSYIIKDLMKDYQHLHNYLYNNYYLMSEERILYKIKKNIEITESESVYGSYNISITSNETTELSGKILYIDGDYLILEDSDRIFVFRKTGNISDSEFHKEVEEIIKNVF